MLSMGYFFYYRVCVWCLFSFGNWEVSYRCVWFRMSFQAWVLFSGGQVSVIGVFGLWVFMVIRVVVFSQGLNALYLGFQIVSDRYFI